MGLDQQLADFKAEFLRTAPAGRPALYEAKIEELRAGFALEAAVGVEARAPDFRLPDVRGNPVSDVSENDSAVPGDYICRGYRQLPLSSPLIPGSALLFDRRAARSSSGSAYTRPKRSRLQEAARARLDSRRAAIASTLLKDDE
jgi:hypothetical protein